MSIAVLASYVSFTNDKLQLQSILPIWTHVRSNKAKYSVHINKFRNDPNTVFITIIWTADVKLEVGTVKLVKFSSLWSAFGTHCKMSTEILKLPSIKLLENLFYSCYMWKDGETWRIYWSLWTHHKLCTSRVELLKGRFTHSITCPCRSPAMPCR